MSLHLINEFNARLHYESPIKIKNFMLALGIWAFKIVNKKQTIIKNCLLIFKLKNKKKKCKIVNCQRNWRNLQLSQYELILLVVTMHRSVKCVFSRSEIHFIIFISVTQESNHLLYIRINCYKSLIIRTESLNQSNYQNTIFGMFITWN